MITLEIKENVDETIFAEIVDTTLSLKKTNPDYDTTDFEQQIDNLVYKLYDLTYTEVKVVDLAFALSESEYNNIEI